MPKRGKRITNIVFMGMGEPFANWDAVMGAVALLNDPHGFGLGHRHITISTVGVVPQIDQFADSEGIQVNLAISLHAPTDAIRSQIMPVNLRYPVPELMDACARYVAKTKRKVFYSSTSCSRASTTGQRKRERWPALCATTSTTST